MRGKKNRYEINSSWLRKSQASVDPKQVKVKAWGVYEGEKKKTPSRIHLNTRGLN